ncbi:MAG: hypothetical protein AAF317_13850 [Pseudomonadota bacterium]
MKNLMIVTAIAATALGGIASAESTVTQQQHKLDRIFAEQRAGAEIKQATRNDEGGFFTRTFGGISLRAINPEQAELGTRSNFRAGDRGR